MRIVTTISFFLICLPLCTFAQKQNARLSIEQIPGYSYPKTINPTIRTSPI